MVKIMAAKKRIDEEILIGMKERETKMEDLGKDEMGVCPVVREIADHAARDQYMVAT